MWQVYFSAETAAEPTWNDTGCCQDYPKSNVFHARTAGASASVTKFPFWTWSVRPDEHTGHRRAASASGLWAGFQSGLHLCSKPVRALLRPSAATSALSPHPVPLFLPPADLALVAPEPMSCLSLAGIKQLNAWADYFRDSLPPVPKDNCHWVWGLPTKPLDPTTVRILAQSIDALRDWGGGTSSSEIQRSVGIVYKWPCQRYHNWNGPLVAGCSLYLDIFHIISPYFYPCWQYCYLLTCQLTWQKKNGMIWIVVSTRMAASLGFHHCKWRGMRVSGAYIFYVLLNDKRYGADWIWEPK